MSTADIVKEAVFDPRIKQEVPRYAVDKGALSVTNAPFLAVSQTASQHTYNINAPSLQTFIDRALQWTSTCRIQCVVTVPNAPAQGTQILTLGQNSALCAFPLNSLVSTMTANINDTTVALNTETTLKEILRLTDYKRNRLMRTCPTMLDKYAVYDDAGVSINNPCQSYLDASDYDNVPNGAYYNVRFIDPNSSTGAPLSGNGTYVNTGVVVGPANVSFLDGVPVTTPAPAGADPANSTYFIGLEFTSTEKLVLSPFVYADSEEYSTGLFGINNIQLVMNMGGNQVQRLLRLSAPSAGAATTRRAISNVQFLQAGAPFKDSKIDITFLTPSLDLPLPAKSVVPYFDFPRFVSPFTGANHAAGASVPYASQTITLPSIPDMLIIYAKPRSYTAYQGDFYLPITRLSMNFNNFSGLLSSMTAAQLYAMSVKNGLEIDWNAWSGRGKSGQTGKNIPLVGGFLVLRPGEDIALQSGEAPGLQGQITLQFEATVFNQTAAQVNDVDLYVITAQSGFFQSLAGSSRIVKNVLSEADIISAPEAGEGSMMGLKRVVGGGFLSSLGNALSKAVSIYTKTKPVVSAIKEALPADGKLGKAKEVLGAVGYGAAGGAKAGAGQAGGLSKRLM